MRKAIQALIVFVLFYIAVASGLLTAVGGALGEAFGNAMVDSINEN